MRPDILIVGQGLAGTWLAWECERAGVSFAITDAVAAEPSASRVAAGIVNPITGRRLVKSWRIDALQPAARAAYRELEATWDVNVWHEMRVWRIFRDDRERQVHREKSVRGELTPFAGAADEKGFWIEGAARVDVRGLLEAARERWRSQGRMQAGVVEPALELDRYELVVDCRGVAGARDQQWSGVPWEFSKGETLALEVAGLEPDVTLNCGHWLLPVGAREAWVGATHEPGKIDTQVTSAARVALEASAKSLLGERGFTVNASFAGVRVNLPDKRPVVGRHFADSRFGLMNGLGAKGVSLAPMLARQWLNHLTEGVAFDAEVNVARFWKGRGETKPS